MSQAVVVSAVSSDRSLRERKDAVATRGYPFTPEER